MVARVGRVAGLSCASAATIEVAAVEAEAVVELEAMEAERDVVVDGVEGWAEGFAWGNASRPSVWDEGTDGSSFIVVRARCWAAWEKCRLDDGDELGWLAQRQCFMERPGWEDDG